MNATLIPIGSTNDPTKKYHLKRFPIVLGRSVKADITLADVMVSRQHCRLEAAEGTLIVEDLASRNGTFVNGCRVLRSVVMPGDQLTFGRQRLRVVYERSSLNPPPPVVYAFAAASSCSSPRQANG